LKISSSVAKAGLRIPEKRTFMNNYLITKTPQNENYSTIQDMQSESEITESRNSVAEKFLPEFNNRTQKAYQYANFRSAYNQEHSFDLPNYLSETREELDPKGLEESNPYLEWSIRKYRFYYLDQFGKILQQFSKPRV
jgi:hypothetical protein